MVSQLGVEPRLEYLAIELNQAARRLVTEVRPIQPGQQVLISADTSSDRRVIEAVAGAVYACEGIPSVIWYPTLAEPMLEPPAPVSAAAKAAEVWFDFAVSYQLYSPTYHQAIRNGCIYVCLTGMDVDMLVRTVGKAPFEPLQRMQEWLYRASQAASRVRMTSPAGSDLYMQIDKAGDPFWELPPVTGGYPQMLGGQSGFMAKRESYEGVLVFDGALWPPATLGLLKSPIRLEILGGYIQQIEGGFEVGIFRRWLENAANPYAYLMDHACYGFNPGVIRPSGRILEDERVFGCMQFGIGATELGSPAHCDGVVMNPSVWLDDMQIEQEGRYTHPELIEFCQQMGVSGY